MWRVIVQLVPHGIEERARTYATAEIWNTGSNKRAPLYGNYNYVIKLGDRVFKSGSIHDHLRLRPVWHLIKLMLSRLPDEQDARYLDNR